MRSRAVCRRNCPVPSSDGARQVRILLSLLDTGLMPDLTRTFDRSLLAVATCCVVAALAVWILRDRRPAEPYIPPAQVVDGWKELGEGGHRSGSATAPIQIVVFTDYECSFCRAFEVTLGRTQDSLGDSVAVTYRALPLPIHRAGYKLAIGSFCAEDQGAFAAYHVEAFEAAGRVTASTGPDSTELAPGAVATHAGVANLERFAECLRRPETRDRLVRNARDASRLGLAGVPTVVVNGRVATGNLSADSLDGLVYDAQRRVAADRASRGRARDA